MGKSDQRCVYNTPWEGVYDDAPCLVVAIQFEPHTHFLIVHAGGSEWVLATAVGWVRQEVEFGFKNA